ncbi:MAG: transporter substrate-binding domain-containing protein [Rubrivivax sp.]|nr:transporter substrate-binding domain-containing protein [Rubrivivax sp.]
MALATLASVAALAAVPAAQAAPPGSAPVRFAPERDYGPFVYEAEDGRIAGLSVDILQLVQQHAGFEVTMLPPRPLAEQLAAARRGEVDLLSSLRPTAERGEYLLFSAPYVSVPAVLVVAAAAPGRDAASSLKALVGQAVAVGAGYAVEAPMRAAHPQVAWQAVSDDVVALRGVAEGRYRAAVVDLASFHFAVRQHRIAGLAPAEQVGFEYRLSFAAPRQQPELIARIDQTLARLPVAERQAIVQRWIPAALPQRPPRAPWTTAIGLGLLALAAAGAAWGLVGRRRAGKRPADAAPAREPPR